MRSEGQIGSDREKLKRIITTFSVNLKANFSLHIQLPLNGRRNKMK